MAHPFRPAPDWTVSQWFNADATPPTLATLRGRVIVLSAFQMLCPACVEHSIPQIRRIRELFSPDTVAVIGLHTVFEHHDAMTPTALQAFLHEYRISIPVGVDAPDPDGRFMPQTMRRYDLQGTPSTLLIDRAGRLRRKSLGHVPDLRLGAEIMSLVAEREDADPADPAADSEATGPHCTPPS
ncbi:TlpA disulfide reductase family protein [Hyphobacterium marinum]|uniref:TlpA disulfide reductase family protein n=1 Tax=Hyphobacterium marinum TaxID=3116574 RepID=A0ABU7M026_9PROT|nr:TlpA disulfide reductase family protein [Hyphobacterium sp. Y6023]MEE2567153.1 TlpA disulfide reductase family protein [Hyphobacterium sp. Y6023]